MRPAVLCIGGLDPSGRAGLLADTRAVEAMGARPLCVATALTFQSSRQAAGFEPVAADILRRQLLPLIEDEPVAAIKLGQLASLENARTLAAVLPEVPLVLDTPLVASLGAPLFPGEDVREAYRPLLARATLVTPNLPELSVLAGGDDLDPAVLARGLEARAVLVKGGHAEGARVTDVLIRSDEQLTFASDRLPGRFRGTGCRLASAIAARLAVGDELVAAIGAARAWLVESLRTE